MISHLVIYLPLITLLEASSYATYYGADTYGYGNRGRGLQWNTYQPVVRNQRSPLSYYSVYPFSRSYLEDYYRYYPQDTYPVYYPRRAKYDMYQVVPSYYQKPLSDSYDNFYYNVDPLEYQEELLQEVEREEREESQPIGHEMLYENEDYTNNFNKYDKASMDYFQKMLAESHKNTYNQHNAQYLDYSDYDNEWQDIPATKLPPYHQREDKDVQDLRKLKNKNPKNKQYRKKQNQYRNEIHEAYKRSNIANEEAADSITSSVPKTQVKTKDNDIKGPVIKVPASSTVKPVSIEAKKNERGQKEEVMMRPATPVRHPFSAPMMNLMVNNDDFKRRPSVFDTLKRMLEMEKSLKNKYREELRPAMRKRIISDEDSLTRQLSVLKKSH